MSQSRIAFYFDFVCPWAYLASLRIEAIAARHGAAVEHRPILLGGVFRAIGAVDDPNRAMSGAKLRYAQLDLARWAGRLGVELRAPASHPRRTVLALRAVIATGAIAKASRALFAAYWKDGRDLESADVVRSALDAAGLDGARAVADASLDATKAELRRRTDQAVADGVFGVPSFVVQGPRGRTFYWGQDRLEEVERDLAAAPVLELWFDYASPYAYLASTQVRALAGRTGARVSYRPLLLGALFKAIGTSNVPLFDMPEPKRLYQGEEIARWSRRHGVPFRFASRFPINTVKALRLTLLAPEERRADLVDALFRAVWVDDRDVTDEQELARIATAAGLDAASLLPKLADAETKELLRSATAAAEARGIFGVPTIDVGGELFWGQDRLDWVERALAR